MDLNGVPSAHGDVGLRLAGQVRELMANTDAAFGIALRMERLETPAPYITRQKTAVQGGEAAREKLHGFGNFEGGDEIDDRAKNADGVAGFLETSARGGFEQTRETRRLARENGHAKAVTGNGSRVDPGSVGFDSEIVDEEAGFEIVRAIEDERKVGKQLRDVAWSQISDYAFDLDIGINEAQASLGSNGLRQGVAGVQLGEKRLPLEVGGFDEIAIDDAKPADAGADEEVCCGSTNRAAADKDGTGGPQALLSVTAQRRKKHLSRVFLVQRVNHVK